MADDDVQPARLREDRVKEALAEVDWPIDWLSDEAPTANLQRRQIYS